MLQRTHVGFTHLTSPSAVCSFGTARLNRSMYILRMFHCWQRWLDPDSPKHKPKLYAKLSKSISDNIGSDSTGANKENVDEPNRKYEPEDFIPKIAAQDGRCPITALPLTMAGGYAFPSLNRLKRKPGHVPPNTEFVAHMANGYGNARSVEDDVLTRKRMVEMCLHTKFLELSLTKLERLALRVLYDA